MPRPNGLLNKGEDLPPGTLVQSIHEINRGCRGRIVSSEKLCFESYRIFRLKWIGSVPVPENTGYAGCYLRVVGSADPKLKKLGIGEHIENMGR